MLPNDSNMEPGFAHDETGKGGALVYVTTKSGSDLTLLRGGDVRLDIVERMNDNDRT